MQNPHLIDNSSIISIYPSVIEKSIIKFDTQFLLFEEFWEKNEINLLGGSKKIVTLSMIY